MNYLATVSWGLYPTSGEAASYWPELIVSWGLMDEELAESVLTLYALLGFHRMGMCTVMT